MSWTTFFILILLTIAVGLLVVRFWKEILVIYWVSMGLMSLVVVSGFCAFAWYFCKGITTGVASFTGWEKLTLYFFIAFLILIAVYATIIAEIFSEIIKLVRKYVK